MSDFILVRSNSMHLNLYVCQGDELLSVNGMDVKGKSAFEASSLIQGPSGTFVNIMVVFMYLSKSFIIYQCDNCSNDNVFHFNCL